MGKAIYMALVLMNFSNYNQRVSVYLIIFRR